MRSSEKEDEAGKRAPTVVATEPPTVIPVIEEQAEIGRRVVDTGKGVRVHKRVTVRDEQLDQPLYQEELIVERVPVGRIVTGPEPTQHYEGETLVVPVLEEVLEKKIRLKEEVRITRRRRQVNQPQTVTLRSEEVSVERFDEGGGEQAGGRHEERSGSGV